MTQRLEVYIRPSKTSVVCALFRLGQVINALCDRKVGEMCLLRACEGCPRYKYAPEFITKSREKDE